MAGVVRTCGTCGKTLWDEETDGRHICDRNKNKELEDYSFDVLKAEVERREKILKEREETAKQRKANEYLEFIPTFLKLTPRHTGIGCSDVTLNNAHRASCRRCFLLKAKQDKHWPQNYRPDLVLTELCFTEWH